MKLISILTAAAVLGLGVSLLALSSNAEALGFYAAAASVLIVLGAIRDYTPRRPCWQPRSTAVVHFPPERAALTENRAA